MSTGRKEAIKHIFTKLLELFSFYSSIFAVFEQYIFNPNRQYIL
jgi:hypothetical protein